jgi:hypothetical protein
VVADVVLKTFDEEQFLIPLFSGRASTFGDKVIASAICDKILDHLSQCENC